MKRKSSLLITLLSLSIVLLTWTNTALAAGRTIIVEYVTVRLSDLNSPALTSADQILVRNSGNLWVDTDATLGLLTIGDGSTVGYVKFDGTARTIQLNSDGGLPGTVQFGIWGGELDMAYLTPATPHILKVQGQFLPANTVNTGTFWAGAGTIDYCANVPQNVSANVSGGGAVIQYKNLTLSCPVSTTNVVKTFLGTTNTVTVQGRLTIKDKAVVSGPSVTYGSLASLFYNGSVAQTTTTTEWPAGGLAIPVIINSPIGIALDAIKVNTSSLTIQAGSGALDLATYNLSIGGNIENWAGIRGSGNLLLNGGVAQVLSGTGTYGNVTLNNAAGASLPSANTFFNGRVTITSGLLKLPNGTTSTAALLTYGSADRAGNLTYGSSTSSADIKTDTYFDPSATGRLFVNGKPASTVTQILSTNAIIYGDSSITITGRVTATSPSGFGNDAALNSEVMSNVLFKGSAPVRTNVTTVLNGGYTYTINTTLLVAGTNYTFITYYKGGVNLAPSQSSPGAFTVGLKPIYTYFGNYTNIYGSADPAFNNTYIPASPFVNGDNFGTNVATRQPGITVGSYTILPGNLATGVVGIGSNSYALTFATTNYLLITPKAVTISAVTTTKALGSEVPNMVIYTGLVSPQTAPAMTNATVVWTNGTPALCSDAGAYGFYIRNTAYDTNYTFSLVNPTNGTLTVTNASVTVTVNNTNKLANGAVFNAANYTVTYVGFVCGDTAATAFNPTNPITFYGPGVTATNAGVYQVFPGGLTSSRYTITFVPGWLAITAPISTTTSNNAVTWSGTNATPTGAMTNLVWMINKVTGAAGTNWSLLQVSNTLNIVATAADPFRIDMVTLLMSSQVGPMAKWDPTRPFAWEIARANAINVVGGDPLASRFWFNMPSELFQDPTFGGQFAITQVGNSIVLNYTPVGATLGSYASATVPDSYYTNGGTLGPVLGFVTNSDVDTLFLEALSTNITPQGSVTFNLRVANLKQSVVGADAYFLFDSRFFNTSQTGPGSPEVTAGGGDWDTAIYTMWDVAGDLDTVMAVNLRNPVGTSADGIVAKIKLYPTRTATGNSRVVFRQDGAPKIDGSGPLTTDLIPFDNNLPAVLPARVMSSLITVTGGTNVPVIDASHITATQIQPHVGQINVVQATNPVVRTSGGISLTKTSGPVVISIPAWDLGVGLSGPPTLILTNGAYTASGIVCITPWVPGTMSNTFVYQWTVPANASNGLFYATVIASDTMTVPTGPHSTTNVNAFKLRVNTVEVTGVVELESFMGTNRSVTFKAGNFYAKVGGAAITQSINLNFISGPILNAGAFQNQAALVAEINPPSLANPLCMWLRYGSITNLATLAGRLANPQPTDGVSWYINNLLYGTFANMDVIADKLWSPVNPVDDYIIDQIESVIPTPPATMLLLAQYENATDKTPYVAPLTAALLDNFNTIVRGPSIYDPVRFASIILSSNSWWMLTNSVPTEALNRSLLADAYPGNYLPGQLQPLTAALLSDYRYTGTLSNALGGLLLQEFDTLTLDPDLWPTPQAPYDQGLYNQAIWLQVELSPTTVAMLTNHPTGTALTLLNQYLLQDAYVGSYTRAPLTPATVAGAQAFNWTNNQLQFVTNMTTDLNALINGGSCIPTNYFAPWMPFGSAELNQLLALPSPTPDQLVRMNRLLLETGLNTDPVTHASVNAMSTSVLATYRLVAIPWAPTKAGAFFVSAKTQWNLGASIRQAQKGIGFIGLSGVANFVNNGLPAWQGTLSGYPWFDYYLRGGDINNDNVINLQDYNILRSHYTPLPYDSVADVNGDGQDSRPDYNLMQGNWGQSGDLGD